MQLTKSQLFSNNHKTKITMHNLRTNFVRFYRLCKDLFKDETVGGYNFQYYPVSPKMNDLEIIALSCYMEALSIDSENLLWSKLKADYADQFPRLIDGSRLNRRRKRLQRYMEKIQTLISERFEGLSKTMVIDSVPVPVVKMARETTYKSFRESYETTPAKGYSAVNKGWFIGYKLHVVIWHNGVVQQSGLTKGNIHDISYLKRLENLASKKELLGDRAYISKGLQLNLFEQYEVKLKVPFRCNQHDYMKHPKRYRSKRQLIETFFPQLCDQMNIKRNYAKSYKRLATRLTSKLSAMSILNWINYLNGRKLSQVKHALSF